MTIKRIYISAASLAERTALMPDFESRIQSAVLCRRPEGIYLSAESETYQTVRRELAERARATSVTLRSSPPPRDPSPREACRPRTGPGSQLKGLLAQLRIFGNRGCGCEARSAAMDRLGVQWCKDNVDVIVGWLREEAAARKLPFVEFAVRLLVKRAIRLAAKAEAAENAVRGAVDAPSNDK